jgi:hypothetical protein
MTCPFCETPAGKVAGHGAPDRLAELDDLPNRLRKGEQFNPGQLASRIEQLERQLQAYRGKLEAADQHVKILREQIALAAPPADAWQPIETAPKDGTVVLVYASDYQDLPGFISTIAYHDDAGWCVDELRPVTHWMRLPSPPIAAAPTGGKGEG